MNRADRERWASARTLADLGELTALWLEGRIGETPDYLGPPDDETACGVPVLAACNRKGFLTGTSQPGVPGDGRGSAQRAGVQGFCDLDTATRLCDMADAAGLETVAWPAMKVRTLCATAEVVTTDCGKPFTWFGTRLSRRDIRREFSGCSRDAVRAVCKAWQVTILDPEWGRVDSPVWTALAAFAGLAVTA